MNRRETLGRSVAGLVALVLVSVLAVLGAGGDHAAAGEVRLEGPVADGVVLTERAESGPVTSVNVRIHPGAPVRLVPILSGNRVDGGREVVSSMCDRVGGVVCVNANFPTCPSCGHPFGGIVQDRRLVRSPTWAQDQVSVVDGRLTLQPWRWSAGLWALGADRNGTVAADGVNVGSMPEGIVLYTPDYGRTTRAPAGSYELIVRVADPLHTGVGRRQQAELVGVHTAGAAVIPADGAVLSARGAGAARLWAWVEAHRASLVELVVNTDVDVVQSFAGHPVLLRDGQAQPLDHADGKVRLRHPRTLLGWDDEGMVWVVIVDGRSSSSRGMTLYEATDHLLALGARHAVNLDGGGSSTMVTSCPSATGWCLRNRPSDGRQRQVWVALALVPTDVGAPAPTTTTPPPTTTPPTTTTTTTPPTATTVAPDDPEPEASTAVAPTEEAERPTTGGPDRLTPAVAAGAAVGPDPTHADRDPPAPVTAPVLPMTSTTVPAPSPTVAPNPSTTPPEATAGDIVAAAPNPAVVVPARRRGPTLPGPGLVALALAIVVVDAAALHRLLGRRR